MNALPPAALAALAATWTACAVFYALLPPSPDQFQHAYLGWRLLEGDVPYRDVIDVNWPGVMALHAIAIALFGVNMFSWRVLDFLLFALAAVLLSDLARRAAGRSAGIACLFIAPFAYAGHSYWLAGQHDMSAAQFLVAALWFHVRGYERGELRHQAGTGIAIALAMLNKPTVGVVGLLLPLHALWCGQRPRAAVAHTAVAGTSSLLALAAAAAAVAARGTSWRELFDATWAYNAGTQYVGEQTLVQMLGWFAELHAIGIPVLTVGALPAAAWIFARRRRSFAATALPLLWITGALSFLIQWRGFGYHLAPCMVALIGGVAISAALAFGGAGERGDALWRGALAKALMGAIVVGVGVRFAATHRAVPALLAGDPAAHLGRFHAADEITFADVLAALPRVRAAPPGCMLLVGDASSISYLARRAMPTRFYYYHVIEHALPQLAMSRRWIDLWKSDLDGADCPLALLSREVHVNWLKGGSEAAAALRRHIERYRRAGSIGAAGGIVVYER